MTVPRGAPRPGPLAVRLAGVALLGACAHRAPALQDLPDGAPVALRFAWAPGMRAERERALAWSSTSSVRATSAGEVRARDVVEVRAHEAGLALHVGGGRAVDAGPPEAQVTAALLTAPRTLVVDPQGALVAARLDEPDAIVDALLVATGDGGPAGEAQRAALVAALSPAALAEAEAPLHARLAGLAGLEVVPGGARGWTDERTGAEVTERVTGPVPCADDHALRRCVRVTWTEVGGASWLAEAVRARVDALLGAGAVPDGLDLTPTVRDGRLRRETAVVLEVSTLRPWSVRATQTTHLELAFGFLPERVVDDREERVEETWRWDGGPL